MSLFIFSNISGSIDVRCTATLKDPENMSEQFFMERMRDVNTFQELDLFYFWTFGVPWTLNELNFFCNNNNICLGIFDNAHTTLLNTYGICSGSETGIFSDEFDDTFA